MIKARRISNLFQDNVLNFELKLNKKFTNQRMVLRFMNKLKTARRIVGTK